MSLQTVALCLLALFNSAVNKCKNKCIQTISNYIQYAIVVMTLFF